MPIRRFLASGSSFAPHELTQMSAAFEKALAELGIRDRESEAACHVAQRIITLAKSEPSQTKLCEAAVRWYKREAVPA